MRIGDLKPGAEVLETKSGISFLVASQNHPGYGGTTLIAKHIIDVGVYDAAEPDNPNDGTFTNVRAYGSSNYSLSNIHQWLNSDLMTDWYSPAHQYDAPPTASNIWYGEHPSDYRSGFLSRFSREFKDALLEVEIPFVVRQGVNCGSLEFVSGKFFLPSRTELTYGDELGVAEGSPFPLFEIKPDLIQAGISPDMSLKYGRTLNPPHEYADWDAPGIFDPQLGWKYWLRTSGSVYSYLVRYCHPFFALSYEKACNDGMGIRPAVNVSSDHQCSASVYPDQYIF